jgi:hypothetical protein
MKINTRQRAFFAHLLLSILLLFALLGIIFSTWYPNDLIHVGGIDGLKILFGVDIVLGPLLTVIVFSPNKKGLAMDLTLIGLLQIACLCAGLWIIYNQRPVLEIVADDGVYIVSASDARQYQIDLDQISGRQPKKAMIELPDEVNAWSTIRFTSELVDGKPFSSRQDLYRPLKDVEKNVFDARIVTIQSRSRGLNATLQLNKKLNSTVTPCNWIPLISPHTKNVYACVSQQNGVERLSSSFFDDVFPHLADDNRGGGEERATYIKSK